MSLGAGPEPRLCREWAGALGLEGEGRGGSDQT